MKTSKRTRASFVLAVFATLVLSCALIAGCSSGSNSGTPGTNTASSSKAKPAKNGFNEKTNKTVTMGSYSFSIPDYFEENASKSSDKSKVFQVKNGSAVEGEMVLSFEKATGSNAEQIKNASSSQIESLLKKYEENIQKSAASVSDAKNTNIAGYPAKSATFVEKGSGEKWTDSYVIFVDTDAAEAFTLILGTTENSDYDYSGDYQKIIDSITKASSSSSSSASSESSASSNEVSPDFKATMDSYEAFFDEYVEFMKEYMENPTDTKLLSKYSNMLSQYSKMMNALNGIDEDSLSTADAAYYLEVSSRITKKLSEVL